MIDPQAMMATGTTWYRDYKCAHCVGLLKGDRDAQLIHESDCPSLIAYAEQLKTNPEAIMLEDLVPYGVPYTK